VEIVQPNFGVRIRKLRLDRGLTQLQLADLIGLSEDQVGNIERGKSWVGEQTLALIAQGLNVPQSSLFDYTQNDDFLKNGGFKARAPRKPAPLIVRHKGTTLIGVPKNER
jgi:transcriptional regulator with XRE-family HTH domain